MIYATTALAQRPRPPLGRPVATHLLGVPVERVVQVLGDPGHREVASRLLDQAPSDVGRPAQVGDEPRAHPLHGRQVGIIDAPLAGRRSLDEGPAVPLDRIE